LKLLVVTPGLECSTLDPVGGWMRELCARLAAGGHRVTVLCTGPADPREPYRDPSGVTVWRPSPSDQAASLAGLLALEPDVVHVAAPGPLAPEAIAHLAGAPLLIDVLDWSPFCPAGDLLARPRDGACAQHHPVAPCESCIGHARVRAMEPFLAFARAGHRVVAHSAQARDRATLALGRGVSLVPVGVDATRFTPEAADPGLRTAHPLANDVAAIVSQRNSPRVVTLGPPTRARGGPHFLDLLVALNARVPGVELVVPGTDPEHPDLLHILEVEARELGIGAQLRVLPRVSESCLPALLASCDVGVAPGIAPDPLGLAIIQSLAAGLPVVAHPTDTASELLQSSGAGVLVASQPAGAFADAVASLLTDRASRDGYRERARLAALERHDIERAIVDTEALYASARAAHRAGARRTPPHRGGVSRAQPLRGGLPPAA
jgi:glycosyltransferase involved in cell wall biosynthesis